MATERAAAGGSPEEFVRSLGECGVTGLADLGAEAGGLAAGVLNGPALARELVDAGKLTAWQAAAVLERRFGDLLVGNYEILDRLGAGGMGTVFKARHRRMKRVVALKVLSAEASRESSFAQRFQREVETIARLTHPNVVMAFDADESDRGPFLVMEFVDGRDLASEVAGGGPLAAADAVECLLQSARGLEYAHAQGIVHRDIKPGNIIRDVSGVVKVADLGLARLNRGNDGTGPNTSLTQAGGIVGTMDYMPPEQAIDSTTIDQRADIYSLGCTLYYLLVGRPPYIAGSLMALLLKHREAPIPRLRDDRPELPAELDDLFARMVAKAPADRFQSMTEVVAALEHLKRAVRLGDTRPAGKPAGATGGVDSSGVTIDLSSAAASASRDTSRVVLGPGVAFAPVPPPTGPLAGLTVVLAEPSRTQAGIIRRYLTQLGAGAVVPADSGRDALDHARRERADAVVCAMHLPDTTGAALARALLADPVLARAGIVIAASETDAADAESLPADPRVVRMPKPFDADRLAAAVAAAVRR